MATLTNSTFLCPHNPFFNLHPTRFKYHPSVSLHYRSRLLRRFSKYTVSQAIRTPKFDFNFTSFEDDDYGDDNFQKRKRTKGRKSGRRSKQKQWWSDGLDDESDVQTGLVEQIVDNLWILRVFRSYGLFLPIILVSFLIATGPKAFLLASGIPFGLSVIIFAFQKVSEWLEGSPRPRNKRRKRSKVGRKEDVFMEEEDDQEEERRQSRRNKKRLYQSWVAQNNGSFYNNDSKSRVSSTSYGGWDDLITENDAQLPQTPPRVTERLQRIVETEEEEVKSKLSESVEERNLPLLLKLLVAVFPFLATWTDIL
ncbi:unnamed protein product [Amaranthus hypochondriacus]